MVSTRILSHQTIGAGLAMALHWGLLAWLQSWGSGPCQKYTATWRKLAELQYKALAAWPSHCLSLLHCFPLSLPSCASFCHYFQKQVHLAASQSTATPPTILQFISKFNKFCCIANNARPLLSACLALVSQHSSDNPDSTFFKALYCDLFAKMMLLLVAFFWKIKRFSHLLSSWLYLMLLPHCIEHHPWAASASLPSFSPIIEFYRALCAEGHLGIQQVT